MFKQILISILFSILSAPLLADSVSDQLKRADGYRLADAESKVELEVKLYRDDQLDRSKAYTVYMKPGRRSLVLFRASGENGQKVLMVDQDFWILMPGTRRPLRISPMQKLLGDASTGDVATLTWSEDYAGRVVDADYAGEYCAQQCSRLELTSVRKGTTYQRIELWLDAQDVPVYARLYLLSGRLAKEARYQLGELNGRPTITRMTLFDSINTNRRTEIEYRSIQATQIPDKFYNPVFLLRENLEDW